MRELFSWNFLKSLPTGRQVRKPPRGIKEIVKNLPRIDGSIAKAAPDRPIGEINRIDLAILRLAVFELIIKKEAPLKVIIDEAVELGKEYGSDSSGSFINGALGKLVKDNNII